jgi:tRNA dimethylallyltransferase
MVIPLLPVIVGPTASGKSAVALAVAMRVGGEIVSADSRQVYQRIAIGTAQPTPEERARVPHHLIAELPLSRDLPAGEYALKARERILDVFGRGKLPILVGGSGLHIRAIIDGLFDGPGADPEIRGELERRLRSGGIAPLMAELERVDPVTAARIDPTKPRRVIRALEVFLLTGAPLSRLQSAPPSPPPFRPVQFGLNWPRKELYDRINLRCLQMIDAGLLAEAEALKSEGYTPSLNSLNTVGYKEAFRFLAGEIEREEFIRLFQQNSRRYAKRQLTWFRADPRICWVSVAMPFQPDPIAAQIVRSFKETL